MTDLATRDVAALAEVHAYALRSRSEATRRAYASDWRAWAQWADVHGHSALPASLDALSLWVVERGRTVRARSIRRALSSISVAHQAAGLPTPTHDPRLLAVVVGLERQQRAQARRRTPMSLAGLTEAVQRLPVDRRGIRDKSILTLGWASAMRRSELAALQWEDVEFVKEGVRISIRSSKTDQVARGVVLGIPRRDPVICPIGHLLWWRDVSVGLNCSGPVFRRVQFGRATSSALSGQSISYVVKRAMGDAPGLWGGHSLRAGLATAAELAGVDPRITMRMTRHARLEQLQDYVRDVNPFRLNVVTEIDRAPSP